MSKILKAVVDRDGKLNYSEALGIEKLQGFSLSALFSEIFSKHNANDVENYFTVGTDATTPEIRDVDTTWPRPWVFFRMLFASVLVYLLFLTALHQFNNINLLPGLIMVGSFAIPISTLVFFMEINVRRNVSLYQVVKLVFLGGIVSLIISLLLFGVPGIASLEGNWLGASVAGLVEEPGKLLTVIIVARGTKYKYKLNGLLFGAAVGTGFAAFESAGYALNILLESESLDAMESNILSRGLLAPFGHIVWTAIAGAALWRVKGGNAFSFSMLREPKFLRLFALPVALHMLWNSPLHLPLYGTYVIIGFVGWFVILALVQEGLRELREEKAKACAVPVAGAADASA